MLCGPPGSGKTMTLFSALRALPDFEVIGLNFSSATSPELVLKTFDHYCEYRRTPNGVIMSPIQLGKWLVLFCDEINLPDLDKYGNKAQINILNRCVLFLRYPKGDIISAPNGRAWRLLSHIRSNLD